MAFAQDTAQPHADPLIQVGKRGFMAVFEIFKPTHQSSIDVRDDSLQTLTVIALRFGTYCVLQLIDALLSRPFVALLKMISQKVESTFRCCVHLQRGAIVWRDGFCAGVLGHIGKLQILF